MMRALRPALALGLAGLFAAGCGVGANKRLLTRPPSYSHALGWMAYGTPIDLEELVAEYPALKGKVVTAPEYLEEWERLWKEAQKKGSLVYAFPIPHGATLDIEVVGEEALSTHGVEVDPSGSYSFRYIGPVQLAGKTKEQLEKELKEKYRKLLKNPEVLVHIKRGHIYPMALGDSKGSGPRIYPGQGRVTVMGGGGQAGGGGGTDFGLYGGETLFQVIGAIGGGAEWRRIRIIRRDDQDPLHKGRVIFADAWEFIANADVRQDIPLRPGDYIFIPPKYTLGEHFQSDLGLLLGLAGIPFSFDSLIKNYQTTFFD